MGDGSQIKAGGVHFEIGASTKALKKSLSESQREVATSTKQMGDAAVKAAKAQEAELVKVVRRIRQQLSLGSLTDFERGGLGAQLTEATKQLGEVQSKLPQQLAPDSLVNRLGDKASSALTNAITKGLVGVAAVNAIDQGLRDLGDRIRAASAAGGSLDGREIGLMFGEAFVKGLEAIPLAGALGSITSEVFDRFLFGGAQAQDRQLAQVRKSADELNRARSEISEALRDLQRQALTGVAREVESFERSIDERLNNILEKISTARRDEAALVAAQSDIRSGAALAGGPLAYAGELAFGWLRGTPDMSDSVNRRVANLNESRGETEALRAEGLRQIAERVDRSFESSLERIDNITGAIDAQAALMAQVEKLAKEIAKSYADIGREAEGIAKAEAIRERAAANIAASKEREASAKLQQVAEDLAKEAAREAEQTARTIDGIVSGLERRYGELGKSSLENLFNDLRALGAGDDVIERALNMQAAVEQASAGVLNPKTYGTFGTFLANRLDQQVGNEPLRKMEDKVGKIQRDLERLLRRITDNDGGLSFGA